MELKLNVREWYRTTVMKEEYIFHLNQSEKSPLATPGLSFQQLRRRRGFLVEIHCLVITPLFYLDWGLQLTVYYAIIICSCYRFPPLSLSSALTSTTTWIRRPSSGAVGWDSWIWWSSWQFHYRFWSESWYDSSAVNLMGQCLTVLRVTDIRNTHNSSPWDWIIHPSVFS